MARGGRKPDSSWFWRWKAGEVGWAVSFGLPLFPMSNESKTGASVAVRLMAVVFFLGCVGLGGWSAQLWKKLVAAETQVAELKGQARQAAAAEALQAQNESLRTRVAELEVAARQQQQAALAAAEAKPSEPAKPANGMSALGALASQMMNTPAMRERMIQSQKRTIEMRFGELMNQLGLSPQDRARLVELLAQKQMNTVDLGLKALSNGTPSNEERQAVAASLREANASADAEIRDFFGGDTANYAAYQDYVAQQPVRTQVTALGASLATAGVPLSAQQSSALSGVVAEARRNLPSSRDPNDPANGPASPLDASAMETAFRAEEQMQNQIAERSASFLSPEQISALRQAQAARLNQTKSSVEMARQMMGGAAGK